MNRSKYYEFLDTVLQMLKGRDPPNFAIHVFHHACVVGMSWAWLEYTQSLQFIGLLFNTFVHTVMYYYYFRVSYTGVKPRWKAAVTSIQVVQFVTSLICFVVTMGIIYLNGTECAGKVPLLGNLVFNVILLSQFWGILMGTLAAARPGPKDD